MGKKNQKSEKNGNFHTDPSARVRLVKRRVSDDKLKPDDRCAGWDETDELLLRGMLILT